MNINKGENVKPKITGRELRTRVNRYGLLKTKVVRQSLGLCIANYICVLIIHNEDRTDESQIYETYAALLPICTTDTAVTVTSKYCGRELGVIRLQVDNALKISLI